MSRDDNISKTVETNMSFKRIKSFYFIVKITAGNKLFGDLTAKYLKIGYPQKYLPQNFLFLVSAIISTANLFLLRTSISGNQLLSFFVALLKIPVFLKAMLGKTSTLLLLKFTKN